MKYILSVCLFIMIGSIAPGQSTYLAGLRKQLSMSPKEDTFRVRALASLADYYGFVQFDSTLVYAYEIARLSQKLNDNNGKLRAYRSMFFAYNCKGNYPRALEVALNMNKVSEEILLKNPNFYTQRGDYFVGLLNLEMKDYPKAKESFDAAIRYAKIAKIPEHDIFFVFSQMANMYSILNQNDSALTYALRGFNLGLQTEQFKKFFALACSALGNIYKKLDEDSLAEKYFRLGIEYSIQYNNIYFQSKNYNNLSLLYEKMNEKDSAIHYARLSLQLCVDHHFDEFKMDASTILTRLYDSENKNDSTLKFLKIMVAARDSVFSESKGQQFQQYAFNEIQRQQELSTAQERYQSRIRLIALATALAVFLLIAFILYRNNRQKLKANRQIEKAYQELKSTQAQLIQSEKMASLGELTAGIAHEIQNPLNFVNNFSEINTELLDEAVLEMDNGNLTESKAILKELRENEEKINHHGRRADLIVKGMLQHSRGSSGRKELTDINALVEEFLRLSYHGFRAKENAFNATLKTGLDPAIGKVSTIPQDLGRVFQNLFNNAFYYMNEKKKLQATGYEPRFFIQTVRQGNKVEIKMRDNGPGIPDRIVNKIFQPFFTTKPTGQGTGLGLSLCYDIIKAHGGVIQVNSVEGEFTEFIMVLPA